MSINKEILERYKSNRMTIFAIGISTLLTYEDYESLSLEGVFLYLIDFVEEYKANQKSADIRVDANIPYPCATFEDFDFNVQPHIAQSEVETLIANIWGETENHQVITGATGQEKLKFASAIANAFTDKATPTLALSLDKLLIDLRLSFSKNEIDNKLKALNKQDLLFIDGWQLTDVSLEDISLLSLFIQKRKKPLLIVMHKIAEYWRADIQQSQLPDIIKKPLLSHTRIWRFKESNQPTHH